MKKYAFLVCENCEILVDAYLRKEEWWQPGVKLGGYIGGWIT